MVIGGRTPCLYFNPQAFTSYFFPFPHEEVEWGTGWCESGIQPRSAHHRELVNWLSSMRNIESTLITVVELWGYQPVLPPFSLVTFLLCAPMTFIDDKVKRYSLGWRACSNLIVLQPTVAEQEWHVYTQFKNCILRHQWQDMHLLILSSYFQPFLAPLSMCLFSMINVLPPYSTEHKDSC